MRFDLYNIKSLRLNVRRGLYLCLQKFVTIREAKIMEFIAKAKQYIEMPTLTPELLRVFIRKIEVFEKLEKYSRTAGNLINIHYAFKLPEQDGMPVLEMLLPSNMRETA